MAGSPARQADVGMPNRVPAGHPGGPLLKYYSPQEITESCRTVMENADRRRMLGWSPLLMQPGHWSENEE